MLTAAAYYTSPAAQSDLDVAAINVAIPASDVHDKLRTLSAMSFAEAWGMGKEFDEISDYPEFVFTQLRWRSENMADFEVLLLGEMVLHMTISIQEAGSGGTLVDVRAELPDSRLSLNEHLQPYDRKVMAMIVDGLATEYIDSVLASRRMANKRELEDLVLARTGFDREQARAFGRRVNLAFTQSYESDFKQLAETHDRSEYTEESPFDEDEFDTESLGDDAYGDAQSAYDEAMERAEQAGRDAEKAAEDAERAVTYHSRQHP